MGRTNMAHEHRGDPLGITSAAVALVDTHGLIKYWSAAAQNLLGYAAAEVLRRPATSLLLCEDALTSAWSGARRVGAGWEAEVTVRHSTGHPLEVALRACPVRAENGSEWLIAACDIAASHRWELDQAVVRTLLKERALTGTGPDEEPRPPWVNPPAGMEGPPQDAPVLPRPPCVRDGCRRSWTRRPDRPPGSAAGRAHAAHHAGRRTRGRRSDRAPPPSPFRPTTKRANGSPSSTRRGSASARRWTSTTRCANWPRCSFPSSPISPRSTSSREASRRRRSRANR